MKNTLPEEMTRLTEDDIRRPSEIDLINTAQAWGIDPGCSKAMLFCWLDRGLPWSVVRFLAQKHLKLKPQSLSSYGGLWRKEVTEAFLQGAAQ